MLDAIGLLEDGKSKTLDVTLTASEAEVATEGRGLLVMDVEEVSAAPISKEQTTISDHSLYSKPEVLPAISDGGPKPLTDFKQPSRQNFGARLLASLPRFSNRR
jgi:hypothetical protein